MQLLNDNHPMFFSLSIGAKSQFLYPVWERRGGVSINHLFEKQDRAIFTDTNGIISKSAGAKIRKAIDWLVVASVPKKIFLKDIKKHVSFKLNFITLTLPTMQGAITDVEIKNKALNHFLTVCRQKFNMCNYIWKAEAQANGNIHFHITTDTFIHFGDIRRIWNSCMAKFGYIENYRSKMKALHGNGFFYKEELESQWSKENQHKAYMYGCQTNWSNPNSTDVHSVKNIKNLSAYLTKYFCKSDKERRAIKGRLWGMSSNLSVIIKAKIEVVEEFTADLQNSFLNNNLVKKFYDYGVMYKANCGEIITHVGGKLGECYKKLLLLIQKPPKILTLAEVTF